MKEKIHFNKQLNHPEKYEKLINSEVVEYIEIKEVTKYLDILEFNSINKVNKILEDKNVEVTNL